MTTLYGNISCELTIHASVTFSNELTRPHSELQKVCRFVKNLQSLALIGFGCVFRAMAMDGFGDGCDGAFRTRVRWLISDLSRWVWRSLKVA